MAVTIFDGPLVKILIGADCTPIHNYNLIQPSVVPMLIRVEHQITHNSHKLYTFRGIVYCRLCGYSAKSTLRGLAIKCNGREGGSTHGQKVLDNIAKNNLPPGMGCWPEGHKATLSKIKS